MKHKTPIGYRAPLTKRSDIVAWLVNRATVGNSRRGYGVFTFNVKCHDADLSFLNLVAVQTKAGDIPSESIRYLAECYAEYKESESNLWDWAIEDAGRGITDKDMPGYRQLWDENYATAEWEFEGRGGGWLCLTSFDGVTLKPYDGEDILSDPETSYRWLRRLYRFLVQCSHDFRPEAVRSEIEYKAAWTLFHNVCSGVLDDKAHAAKVAAERQTEIDTAPCLI